MLHLELLVAYVSTPSFNTWHNHPWLQLLQAFWNIALDICILIFLPIILGKIGQIIWRPLVDSKFQVLTQITLRSEPFYKTLGYEPPRVLYAWRLIYPQFSSLLQIGTGLLVWLPCIWIHPLCLQSRPVSQCLLVTSILTTWCYPHQVSLWVWCSQRFPSNTF